MRIKKPVLSGRKNSADLRASSLVRTRRVDRVRDLARGTGNECRAISPVATTSAGRGVVVLRNGRRDWRAWEGVDICRFDGSGTPANFHPLGVGRTITTPGRNKRRWSARAAPRTDAVGTGYHGASPPTAGVTRGMSRGKTVPRRR